MPGLDIGKYLRLFRRELFESVVPFWLNHSLDRECGGYFNCLDRRGRVYDTTKHMWLQGRQVWMFSKLYNAVERKPEWREAAEIGFEFIRRCGTGSEGRVYFSVDRAGRPVFIQRKIFSECFYILALIEFSRLVGDSSIRADAEAMFRRVDRWRSDPAALGRPALAGQEPSSSLAVPMIMLSLADEFCSDSDSTPYDPIIGPSVEEILLHLRPDERLVYENVRPDGSLIEGSEGRLLNPGHAIETGWFLLEHGKKRGDRRAVEAGLNMIDWMFEKGWDSEYGGIYYFLDAGGFSPAQLEWPMKLWWPHCEAAYAMLAAFEETGEELYARRFEQVVEYAFPRFSDPEHGEWFGYLDRRGRPTHDLKGGPYKGCFHVPRFLWMSIRLLERMS